MQLRGGKRLPEMVRPNSSSASASNAQSTVQCSQEIHVSSIIPTNVERVTSPMPSSTNMGVTIHATISMTATATHSSPLVSGSLRHLHMDSLSLLDPLSLLCLHLQWQWQVWIILMACQLR